MPVARATPAIFDRRSVVILNDTAAAVGRGRRRAEAIRGTRRRRARRRRRTLRVADRRRRADARASSGAPVDRITGRSATLGRLRLQSRGLRAVQGAAQRRLHVGAHLPLSLAHARPGEPRASRNYDDGAVAAAERRTGAGRVIVWTSTLDDSWTDLPVKPVYLPLVHQLVSYLARYEQTPSWLTVGQVVDLASMAATIRGDRIVVSPSGQRTTQRANSPGLLELTEQGIYEVRAGGTTTGRPHVDCREHRPGRSRPDAARSGRARGGGDGPCHPGRGGRARPRNRCRGKTTRNGRPCGGICSSPACCYWRPKR